MSSIKRHKILFDATAASTGDWVRLDNRYAEFEGRVLQTELTAPNTITLQATTKDVRGQTAAQEAAMLAALGADDIVNVVVITADGPYLLEGPWTFLRAVKTNSTANAKIQGFI